MNISGLLTGIGEKAHEQNLLTLQQHAQSRKQVIDMGLSMMDKMDPQGMAEALELLTNAIGDPKMTGDKIGKELGGIASKPRTVERPTETAEVPAGEQQISLPQAPMQPPPAPPPLAQDLLPPSSGATAAASSAPQQVNIPTAALPPMPFTGLGTGTTFEAEQQRREQSDLAQFTAKAQATAGAQGAVRTAETQAELAGLAQQGKSMGLTGIDLANFIRGHAISTAMPTATPVIGTINGKPAYALKTADGVFHEYTAAGPGRALGPTEFTPKEVQGTESETERYNAAKLRIKEGKGTSEDEQIVSTFENILHRPPQPQVMYVQGAGLMYKTGPNAGQMLAEFDVPTAQVRNMIAAAPQIINFADRILPQIKEQVNNLGPAKGRWAELMTADIGLKNPGFFKLRTNLNLMTTRLMQMHTGSRPAQLIFEHFLSMLDSGKQSPENLVASIEAIKDYADDLKKKKVITVTTRGGAYTVGAERTAEVTPTVAIPPGTVEDGYRYKGGDPASPGSWEKVK